MSTARPDILDPDWMAQRLQRFFARRLPEARSVEIRDYAILLGGYSRLTARFDVACDGDVKGYILRADPPAGTSASDTSRSDEWELLEALTLHADIPTPGARYYDSDGSELGTLAIIIDRIDGGGLSASWDRIEPGEEPEIAMKMCNLMADIHSVDLDVLPPSLARPANWDAYIDERLAAIRQIATEFAEPYPFYSYFATWLDLNRPEPVPLTLVHGELQSSNVILDQDKNLLAIDWEYGHIGDPREDIGWTMLIEAFHPPDLVNVDVDRFFERYRERTGLSPDQLNKKTVAYFMILHGLFVLGVIARQIGSFARGENTDIKTGFLVASMAQANQEWFAAVKMIESE